MTCEQCKFYFYSDKKSKHFCRFNPYPPVETHPQWWCGRYKNGKAPARRVVKNCEEYTQEFKEFWQNYPKKVDQDAAWRAWNKEPKDHAELVIASAEAFALMVRIEEKDMKYIKHPATWLNKGSWKDNYEHKKGPKDCVECGKAYEQGFKYTTDFRGKKVYKCDECRTK